MNIKAQTAEHQPIRQTENHQSIIDLLLMRRYKSHRLQGTAMRLECDIRNLSHPAVNKAEPILSPPLYLSNPNSDTRITDINERLELFWDDPVVLKENNALVQSIPKSHKSYYLPGNVFASITDKEIDSFLTKTLALPEHSSMIAAIKLDSSPNDVIKDLYKDKDAFRACLTFLSMVTKTKAISSKHTAYGLKHDVECFTKYTSTGLYISMTTFIFAAIYSGFLYKGQDNYRHITFNMSARSLNELDKLEYNLKAIRAMPQDHFYLSLMKNI